MIKKGIREYSSQINFTTCELHSVHEDTVNHSGSALCTRRLENPSTYTSDRALQGSLLS